MRSRTFDNEVISLHGNDLINGKRANICFEMRLMLFIGANNLQYKNGPTKTTTFTE